MTATAFLARDCGCCGGTGGGGPVECGCWCRSDHNGLFALLDASDAVCPCVDDGIDGRTLVGTKQGQFFGHCSWVAELAAGPWSDPPGDCARSWGGSDWLYSDYYTVQIVGGQHCTIPSPDGFTPGDVLEVDYYTSTRATGARFMGRVRYARAAKISETCGPPPVAVWRYDFLDELGTTCAGGSVTVTFTD